MSGWNSRHTAARLHLLGFSPAAMRMGAWKVNVGPRMVVLYTGHWYTPLYSPRALRKDARISSMRLASALCATGLLLLPLLVSVVSLTEIGWFVDDAQEKSIIEHLREPQPSDEGESIVEAVLPGGSTAAVR